MTNVAAVRITTVFQLIRADATLVPTNVELCYAADDPHCVQMVFHVGSSTTTWLVSRTLLAEGLIQPSGIGDVRLRPLPGDKLLLALCSEDAHAVMHVPAPALDAFLDSTYEIVPLGREVVDVDSFLEQIFGA